MQSIITLCNAIENRGGVLKSEKKKLYHLVAIYPKASYIPFFVSKFLYIHIYMHTQTHIYIIHISILTL